jgi:mannan endo-1,4-beta-mannosidase
MLTRRTALVAGAAALAGSAIAARPRRAPPRSDFVAIDGARFRLGGRPYHFAGANMWYAAYLGAEGPTGNRDRLRRELDALSAMGVTNLRILGESEHSPLRNSIRPTFRDQSSKYNESLLRGLDFTLAEMGRRGMKAVVYLNNFWEWSGGMMTYLSWVNGGRYLNMNDPAHPWPEFPDMVAEFYSTPRAVAMSHHYLRAVVGRRNTITGGLYRDDPAIMAWQLANEPRPGGSEAVANRQMAAFRAWVSATARLIKSLDPHHLVSTGSEGLKGCVESRECVVAEHRPPEIDYLTTHIWPLNWSWVDSKDLAGTWDGGEAKVREYMAQHQAIARELGKPLVFEEFGFPRDAGRFEPGSPTRFRDRYYQLVYSAVLDSAAKGGALAGSNFWAWGGEGRAAHSDHQFRPGDKSYVGDPMHEPQGWYSVFDVDRSTRDIIAAHARELGRLPSRSMGRGV